MRNYGNFLDGNNPTVVVVCYDAVTNEPSWAITNVGLTAGDLDVVRIGSAVAFISGELDEFKHECTRPQNGGGIPIRSCSFSLKFGAAFYKGAWARRFYGAGANADSFYFGIWCTDRKNINVDLKYSMFLGYYRVDAGTTWAEANGVTKVSCLDILQTLSQRMNESLTANTSLDYDNVVQSSLYVGDFFRVPAYGRSGRTLGYTDGVIVDSFNGVLPNTWDGTGTLVLGTDTVLADNVGATVRVKLSTGEVVSGTITTVSAGVYGLSSVTRHTNWGTVEAAYVGWNSVGAYIPAQSTNSANIGQVVLTQGVQAAPGDNMWLRVPTVNWKDSPNTSASNYFVQLNGHVGNGVFNIEVPPNSTYPYTGVGIVYDAAAGGLGYTGGDAHLNYAKTIAKQTCNTYFRSYQLKTSSATSPTAAADYASGYRVGDLWLNTTTGDYWECVAPTNGSATWVNLKTVNAGVGWSLIVTTLVNTSLAGVGVYEYFIKLRDSVVRQSANLTYDLSYNVGGTFVRIPAEHITSVSYNVTAHGFNNLCKIRLTGSPKTLVNRGITGDDVMDVDVETIYVDTKIASGGADTCSQINRMLSPYLPSSMLGQTLRYGAGFGHQVGLRINEETITQYLSELCGQTGTTLTYLPDGTIEAYNATMHGWREYTWSPDGVTAYYGMTPYTNVGIISQSQTLDRSFNINIGKLDSIVAANGIEYVDVHMKATMLASERGAGDTVSFMNTKRPVSTQRVVAPQISVAPASVHALPMLANMLKIGHPYNYGEVLRVYSFGVPYSVGASLESGDIIYLKNFEGVTQTVSAPYEFLSIPGFGTLPFIKYTDSGQQLGLLPGMCVVENVSTEFGSDGVVYVTCKQAQPKLASTLYDFTQTAILNPALSTPATLYANNNRSYATAKYTEAQYGFPCAKIVEITSLGNTGSGGIGNGSSFTSGGNVCCDSSDYKGYANNPNGGVDGAPPEDSCSSPISGLSVTLELLSPDEVHDSLETIDYRVYITNNTGLQTVFDVNGTTLLINGIVVATAAPGVTLPAYTSGQWQMDPAQEIELGTLTISTAVYTRPETGGTTATVELRLDYRILQSNVYKTCFNADGTSTQRPAICPNVWLDTILAQQSTTDTATVTLGSIGDIASST